MNFNIEIRFCTPTNSDSPSNGDHFGVKLAKKDPQTAEI